MSDDTEKGTQLRLNTVCGGPHSGLSSHNTSSDGHDHDRADHGGYARSWSDRGDPMIE